MAICMDLSDIKPYLIHSFSSEAELVREIEKISYRFNFEREAINEYVESEASVAAYTCFYGLTNVPKWKAVRDKISLTIEKLEIWDIGSGPGTFSLAILQDNPLQKIRLIESSSLMRQQASQLIQALFPASDVEILSSLGQVPQKSSKRLGLFGHSANEMSVEEITQLIERLELDQVLFIEPGTSTYFKKAIELRSRLLQKGYRILFPCPDQADCTLAKNDWCHQYIQVRQRAEVERLSQLVRKDRRLLPLTLHYFCKDKSHQTLLGYRVIRVKKPLKYAQPVVICTEGNQTLTVEVLFKGLTTAQKKTLQKTLAGDAISLEFVAGTDQRKALWRP